jgi:hypothetical protein
MTQKPEPAVIVSRDGQRAIEVLWVDPRPIPPQLDAATGYHVQVRLRPKGPEFHDMLGSEGRGHACAASGSGSS